MKLENEIKEEILGTVEFEINEWVKIFHECGKKETRELIQSLNDNDFFKIKLGIIKTLNDNEELLYILKETFKINLEVLTYNNLNIEEIYKTTTEDYDLFTEILFKNFYSFNVERNDKTNQIEVDFIGVTHEEDQSSLERINIHLVNLFN